jgi:hypothetical protein
MTAPFAPKTSSQFFSFALAALMTLGVLGSVNLLATQGLSDDALLARSGELVLAAHAAQPNS